MGDMISQDEMNELLAGIDEDANASAGLDNDIIHDFLDDVKTYLGYYISDEKLSFEHSSIEKASLNDIKQFSGSEIVSTAINLGGLQGNPILLILKKYDAKNVVAVLNGTDLSEVEDGEFTDLEVDVLKSLIDALSTPIGTLVNKFSRDIMLEAPSIAELESSSQITNNVNITATGFYKAEYLLNTSDLNNVSFTFFIPEQLVSKIEEEIIKTGHTFLSGKVVEGPAGNKAPAQSAGNQEVSVQQNQPQMNQPQMMMNNSMPQGQMYGSNMNNNINAQNAEFQQLAYTDVIQQRENISLIKEVSLEVTVEMGRTSRKIKEILEFSPGTIIELDKIAGDAIDILANGKFIAKGEVVVIDENYGVRITEITGNHELF